MATLIPEGELYNADRESWQQEGEGIFAKLWRIILNTPKIILGITNIWLGKTMNKNQRIVSGIVAIVGGLAAIFGFGLSPEISGVIGSIVALIVGWLIPSGEVAK